jgi:hypothetical protein
MDPPAPNELLDGQGHRPLFRLAPWAFGPLGIPKDHLLAITQDPSLRSDGSAAQVAGQVDEHPVPVGIALADMHVPLLAAQLIQQVLHLLPTLARRHLERPLHQPLANAAPRLVARRLQALVKPAMLSKERDSIRAMRT